MEKTPAKLFLCGEQTVPDRLQHLQAIMLPPVGIAAIKINHGE